MVGLNFQVFLGVKPTKPHLEGENRNSATYKLNNFYMRIFKALNQYFTLKTQGVYIKYIRPEEVAQPAGSS